MTDRPQLHVRVVDGAEDVGEIVTETPRDPGDLAPDGIDLVIVDPGIGGVDSDGWFQQHLEHDHEALEIPLVVCTGNTRILRDLADDLEERNIDLVQKPFDLEELLQVVDAHIGPA